MLLDVASTPMDNLTTIFSWLTTQVGTLITTITSSPILMLGIGVFIAGAVIGLAYRLIRG